MEKKPKASFFSKVSFLDLANFTKHVSVMLKAGINLSESLDTLISQTKSPLLKTTLKHVLTDTNNGATLSSAMEKYPSVFDQFYVNIIRIGEESGKLDENLEYLSEKLHKDLSLRKKIKDAMFYPTIIVSATLVLGIGLSIFVLPKMGDLFRSFDMQLPLATRMLLWVSDIMKKYNIILVVVLIAAIVLFRITIKLKAVRPYWSKFMLSAPVVGKFVTYVETSSFCRNLGVMLTSNLPISRALEIAEKTTENYVFKKHIVELQKSVSEGKLLGDQLLQGHFPALPSMAIRMISVGERSGKLNDMLLYIGDYYEEETDSLAKNFSTVIEPILLLFIGVIVAVVALAIVGPIYQLTGSIK